MHFLAFAFLAITFWFKECVITGIEGLMSSGSLINVTGTHTFRMKSPHEKKRKKVPLILSDDTASMIKGGGYIVARTRPRKQLKRNSCWLCAVAPRPKTWLLFFVQYCIPCFYECRCMSDGVFIQFVCQFLILWYPD